MFNFSFSADRSVGPSLGLIFSWLGECEDKLFWSGKIKQRQQKLNGLAGGLFNVRLFSTSSFHSFNEKTPLLKHHNFNITLHWLVFDKNQVPSKGLSEATAIIFFHRDRCKLNPWLQTFSKHFLISFQTTIMPTTNYPTTPHLEHL